ncbi:MAG: Hsp20/alpha crystallin family protein [candidate division WOR-3 bacterium]
MKRWLEPWRPFRELEEEIRETLDEFFGRSRRFPRLVGEFEPAVEMYEKGEDLIIKADIPGVEKEDLSVSVGEDTVTIKGEVKRDEEVKEKDYYRRERVYGAFSRTLPLPVEVDAQKAKATYRNGVLTLTLPKKKTEKEIKTEIKIE